MLQLLNDFEFGGLGAEVLTGISFFVMSSAIMALLCFAWKITMRRPLEYEMFLVEMHTMTHRRIVEVLHIGSIYRSMDNYGSILERVRSRARSRRPTDGDWIAVSDTNVVIQSPSTVTRPDAQSNVILQNRRNRLTLWEIEIPHEAEGVEVNATRDGQLAAAAAISILGRPLTLSGDIGQEPPRVANFEMRSTSQIGNISLSFHSRSSAAINLPSFRFHTAVSIASDSDVSPATLDGNDAQAQGSVQPAVTNIPASQVATAESKGSKDDSNDGLDIGLGIPEPSDNSRGVQIRLKFLDDSLILTRSELSATVLQFRNANFASAVAQGKVVRLIFKGQLMRDDNRTLDSYGLHEDCVVHCHVSNTPYAQPGHSQQAAPRPAPETSHRTHEGAHHPAEDRVDLWLLRVIVSFFTNQVTAFPLQMRARLAQFIQSHADQLRPSDDESMLSRAYRRWYDIFIVPFLEPDDPVATAAAAAASNARPFCIGNYLHWIFGVQCGLVWCFIYCFPQLCDRTAVGLILLLTLYFFFVVLRPGPHHRLLQPPQRN